MNAAIATLNHWGGSFLNFAGAMLWQSSLLAVVILIVDLSLRHRVRASVRHGLWLLLLVKLVLPPSLALPTSPAWWLSRRTPAVEAPPIFQPALLPSINVGSVLGGDLMMPNPLRVTTGVPLPIVPPRTRPPLTFAGWSMVVALAGSLILLGWLGLRYWLVLRVGRLASNAPSLEPLLAEVQELSRTPAEHKGIIRSTLPGKSRVRVKISPETMSPAVCGLFRPVILLPQALADMLAPAQLRAVLLHELTHVRRGDVWVNLAQGLLQIVYWWHPIVWLANTRIRRVREEAVDDAVMVALRADAEVYAPTLLAVARFALHRPLASLGLVGILESRSALRQRIERLVNLPVPQRAGVSLLSVLVLLAFSTVALPMGGAPPWPATASQLSHRSQMADQTNQANLNLSEPPFTLPSDIVWQALGKTPPNGLFLAPESETLRLETEIDNYLSDRLGFTMEPTTSPQYQGTAPIYETVQKTSKSPNSIPELDFISANASAVSNAQLTVQHQPGNPPLITRIFGLDSNVVWQAMQHAEPGGPVLAPEGDSLNTTSSTFGDFVRDQLGVDLKSPEFFFYSGTKGALYVKATEPHLATMQHNIETLNKRYDPQHLYADAGEARMMVAQVKVAYELGKFDEAETVLNRLFARHPENASAQYYQALVKRAQRENHGGAPQTPGPPQLKFIPPASTPTMTVPTVFSLSANKGLPQLRQQAGLSETNSEEKYRAALARMLPGIDFPKNSLWLNDQGLLVVQGMPEEKAAIAQLFQKLNGVSATATPADFHSAAKPAVDATNLYMRTFKVRPSAFYPTVLKAMDVNVPPWPETVRNEQDRKDFSKDFNVLIRPLFFRFGVDLSSPPKALFYNDRLGLIFVKATSTELDVIERIVGAIIQPPATEHTSEKSADKEAADVSTNAGALFAGAMTMAAPESAPTTAPSASTLAAGQADARVGRQEIARKLNSIVIDKVAYDDLPLSEALRRLEAQVKDQDPEKTEIHFSIDTAFDQVKELNEGLTLMRLHLTNVRLVDVLDAIVLVADHPLKYTIRDYGVVFSAKSDQSDPMVTRTFAVDENTFLQGFQFSGKDSPGWLSQNTIAAIQSLEGAGGISGTNFHWRVGGSSEGVNFLDVKRRTDEINILAKSYFQSMGVDLTHPPRGVFFNDRLGLLFVKAPQSDLDIIDCALKALQQSAPQVPSNATSKKIEGNTSNRQGLKWYAGQFSTIRSDNEVVGDPIADPSSDELQSSNSPAASTIDPANPTTSSAGWVKPATTQIYTGAGRQEIVRTLDSIYLNRVDYDHLPLTEVLRQLSVQAKGLDPAKRGINFLIDPNPGGPSTTPSQVGNSIAESAEISLHLANVRLADLLDAIVLVANHPIAYSVHDFAVVFHPRWDTERALFTENFKVDPGTFAQGMEAVGAASFGGTGNTETSGTTGGATGSGGIVVPKVFMTPGAVTAGPAEYMENEPIFVKTTNTLAGATREIPSLITSNFLKNHGIDLTSPKEIFYNAGTGLLFVKGSHADLQKVRAVIEAAKSSGSRTNIPSREVHLPPATNSAIEPRSQTEPVAKTSQSGTEIRSPNAIREKSAAASPPQIHIKVRFIEVTGELKNIPCLTNRLQGPTQTGIMATRDLPDFLQQIDLSTVELGEPEVTTPAGQETGLGTTEACDLWDAAGQNTNLEIHPGIKVLPGLNLEDRTIQLQTTIDLTVFARPGPPPGREQIYNDIIIPRPVTFKPAVTQWQYNNGLKIYDGQTVVIYDGEGTAANPALAAALRPSFGEVLGHRKHLLVIITATMVNGTWGRLHSDADMEFATTQVPPDFDCQGAPLDDRPFIFTHGPGGF